MALRLEDKKRFVKEVNAVAGDSIKAKPAQSKGAYLKKLTVSSSMGPGVSVDRASVDV